MRIFALIALFFLLFVGPAAAQWNQSPQFLGQDGAFGQSFSIDCAPGGQATQIWGTGTYTSDSSICGAAQHFGWIPPGAGATVTYQIVAGLEAYEGSTANGITTQSYPSWTSSFQITGATVLAATGPRTIGWLDTADGLGLTAGQRAEVTCPPGGSLAAPIWGVGVYTSDSAICVAAAHLGLITVQAGGAVRVIAGGAVDSFPASERNGISSSSYGAWPRSFGFF